MSQMTTLESSPEQRTVGQLANPASTPLKVLAVIDGSEQAGRVVEYALSLGESARPLDVVLLGIIRHPPDGRLRGYGSFKRAEIHAGLKERLEQRAVGAAARRFDQAKIPHKDRIEIGEAVETVLRVADEEGVAVILIGEAPPGVFRRWLPKAIGLSPATTAVQVTQHATIPVVVVK
jgi:nucleotide-binding universal stress UspA family protein